MQTIQVCQSVDDANGGYRGSGGACIVAHYTNTCPVSDQSLHDKLDRIGRKIQENGDGISQVISTVSVMAQEVHSIWKSYYSYIFTNPTTSKTPEITTRKTRPPSTNGNNQQS